MTWGTGETNENGLGRHTCEKDKVGGAVTSHHHSKAFTIVSVTSCIRKATLLLSHSLSSCLALTSMEVKPRIKPLLGLRPLTHVWAFKPRSLTSSTELRSEKTFFKVPSSTDNVRNSDSPALCTTHTSSDHSEGEVDNQIGLFVPVIRRSEGGREKSEGGNQRDMGLTDQTAKRLRPP